MHFLHKFHFRTFEAEAVPTVTVSIEKNCITMICKRSTHTDTF